MCSADVFAFPPLVQRRNELSSTMTLGRSAALSLKLMLTAGAVDAVEFCVMYSIVQLSVISNVVSPVSWTAGWLDIVTSSMWKSLRKMLPDVAAMSGVVRV